MSSQLGFMVLTVAMVAAPVRTAVAAAPGGEAGATAPPTDTVERTAPATPEAEAPEAEAPEPEASEPEASEPEASEPEAPEAEAPEPETPEAEAPEADGAATGDVAPGNETTPAGTAAADTVAPGATEPVVAEPTSEPTPTPAATDPPIATEPDATDDEFGDDEFGDDEFGSIDATVSDDYDPRRDSPEALAARHWVRAGVALLASGGALGLGAIIIGATDPCAPRVGNSCQSDARNRAALTMGIPALAMVGGGVAALVVGRRAKRRVAASVAVAPRRAWARTPAVTVMLRGRF